MGSSTPIRKVFAEIKCVAPTEFTVIVSGETGSGKELVARAIHRQSRHAAGPFVPVDCGAIQPNLIESELFGHEKGAFTGADRARLGIFEAASGGTLFFDEIQNLPLSVQTKLLRALQEKQICRVGGTRHLGTDTRVLAASNQDLPALAAAGQFRLDLFHRLNEFNIHVPPLRERRDDILYLARRFAHHACTELTKDLQGISREATEILMYYSWPGNVRELRNVIRRAVLLAETHIGPDHLRLAGVIPAQGVPPAASSHMGLEHLRPAGALFEAEPQALHLPAAAEFNGHASLKELVHRSLVQVERAIIMQVLQRTSGNKAEAARLLHVDYKTISTKTKQYGISLNLNGGGYHGQG
jgi:two-component system nitrogen regulation response regulator GlnG